MAEGHPCPCKGWPYYLPGGILMIRALWTAGAGMNAQQMNIDVISNNLANVNTTGFKKSRLEFQDLLYQTLRGAGSVSAQGSMLPVGLQVGHGVRPVSSSRIYTQGDFVQTDNALDLLVEGDGFFQILMPDGTTAYTRDGSRSEEHTSELQSRPHL